MVATNSEKIETTQGDEITINLKGATIQQEPIKNLNTNDQSKSGLTKEELKVYMDAPFWVRLRQVLLISFWAIWLAILGTAIGFVVASPGCQGGSSIVGSTNATTLMPASTSSSG